MIMSKILRFTFVLLLIKGGLAFPLRAQTEVADSLSNAATQVKVSSIALRMVTMYETQINRFHCFLDFL